MSRLVLVRHAAVEVVRYQPASSWRLSDPGRRDATALADQFRDLGLDRVISSRELKARETAERIAASLDVPVVSVEGLHEHARESVGWLGADEFHERIREVFARPDETVLGEESAGAAASRFKEAVRLELERPRDQLVVTHGTVIALFAERVAGVDGYGLWRSLGLPAYVVFTRPDLRIERVEARPLQQLAN